MFDISFKKFGAFTLAEIKNVQTGEYVSFFPDYGATINQLTLCDKNNKLHSLLYDNPTYENLISEGRKIYKGSKLFPFPNRVDSGDYDFHDHKYHLPINHSQEGHAIHGLVTESKFKIVDQVKSESFGQVHLQYKYDRENEGYPFKFCLDIIFILDNDGYRCKTIVTNEDFQDIPVGDGWHPYFKLGDKVDQLYLEIPSTRQIEVNEKNIPTGNIITNNYYTQLNNIGNSNLDTCFQLTDQSNVSIIKLVNAFKKLDVKIWMERGDKKYKYVQVYIPPERNCIAIEPMTCMPDVFNNKKDLIILAPGNTCEFIWGVTVK